MDMRIAPERIIVVSPYLRGTRGGHHVPMCLGIVAAARRRGLDADLVIQRNGADPAWIAKNGVRDLLPPMSIPWMLPDHPPLADYRLSFRLATLFAGQAEVLDPLLDDRPTLIVIDGLQPSTFLGLAAWLRERHAPRKIAVLHMCFAFDLIDPSSGQPSSNGEIYAALLSSEPDARGEIAVFGRRHHHMFERLTGQRAAFYPMPMDLPVIPHAMPAARRPLTIVINPRFGGSIDAAIACAQHRFVRRHFDPQLKLASWGTLSHEDKQRLNDCGVPLVGRGVTVAEYANLMRTQGVLLLAYSDAFYRYATSGVMTEAAAAGLVTVVPTDTWLSDCIDEELAAGVTFDALDGRELVRALRNVHRDWPRLNAQAATRAANMRAAHAIDPFLDRAVAAFPDMLAPARTYGVHAGLRLGFEQGNGVRHLLDGWSFAEPWGRWSDGDTAAMRLRVMPAGFAPRAVRPQRLIIEALGLAPADRPQLVDVLCNGAAIGQCQFERGGSAQIFELPLPDAQSQDMHLQFHVRHPVRPMDLGPGHDARRLGFGLIGLRVMAEA